VIQVTRILRAQMSGQQIVVGQEEKHPQKEKYKLLHFYT